jgi:hypothetical protein
VPIVTFVAPSRVPASDNDTLAGPDLSAERARGAALTRSDVLALVGDLEGVLRALEPTLEPNVGGLT